MTRLLPTVAVETAANNRDRVAEKMTPTDISTAQRMAREWLEEHPR